MEVRNGKIEKEYNLLSNQTDLQIATKSNHQKTQSVLSQPKYRISKQEILQKIRRSSKHHQETCLFGLTQESKFKHTKKSMATERQITALPAHDAIKGYHTNIFKKYKKKTEKSNSVIIDQLVDPASPQSEITIQYFHPYGTNITKK